MSSSSCDEIFRTGGFPFDEPHPALVSLNALFEQRGIHRICDLGCGTGRNLIFLARKGFELYGIDVSAEGLRQTRHKADGAGLKAELVQSDMTEIPYQSSFFNAVICIYAIYHNESKYIRRAIAEIHRVLGEGGLVYVTFQTLRSHKYGKGKRIETNTFVQDFPPEQGIPHHFSDEEEVRQFMQAFRVIRLELEEFKTEDGMAHSHWQVLAEK